MASQKSIIPATVNVDLQKERKAATFNVEEFAAWWNGGEDKLKFKREIENYIYKDAVGHTTDFHYLSHEDVYNKCIKDAIDVAKKLRQLQAERNPGGNDIWPALYTSSTLWGSMPAGNPYGVHFAMAVTAIQNQGTDEQYERFGKRAANFEIGITYAQTELGHGTFLRGLETRADYDIKSQEFVLNTPKLSSYKWWPGGLGHSVNYCIVVAMLYINNEPKGVTMFWLQVRDEETHMPLPGVNIGEIGSKMGFYGVNNGYLGLKNVRIPRTNMLMRNSQVQPDGVYVKSPVSVLSYFPMVHMRCGIVMSNAKMLAMGSTIATRYSAVRRQSPINPNDPEPQIIDHVTQQMKLFPEIAGAVAYRLAADNVNDIYQQTVQEIKRGEFGRLAELHSLACALKVLCTYDATAGIERLRLSCGGHGYLTSANMGPLFASSTAACTYEGENTVLSLQCGRFLVKSWRATISGQPLPPSVAYLTEAKNSKNFGRWSGSWQNIVQALQYAAANKIRLAYENMDERLKAGQTQGEASNNTGIELIQAAELHGYSFVCHTFMEEVTGDKARQRSAALNKILENLLEIFVINTALRHMASILRCIPLSDSDLRDLQSRLELALTELRPNAVAICDGFDFHDRLLGSTLGSYDGNVYERIYECAKSSPLNQKPVPDAFEKYLKPFMKSNM